MVSIFNVTRTTIKVYNYGCIRQSHTGLRIQLYSSYILCYWTLQTNTAILCSIYNEVSLPLWSVKMFNISSLKIIFKPSKATAESTFQLQPLKGIINSTSSFELHPNSTSATVSDQYFAVVPSVFHA